jgi:cytidylate kinase
MQMAADAMLLDTSMMSVDAAVAAAVAAIAARM